MSMRPEIYGFEFGAVKKIFGSNDKVDCEKIINIYKQKISETFCDEPNELARYGQEGEEIIHRAIMEGVPFAGLKIENDVHVYVAYAMAHSVDLKSPGDTVDWHMQAFRDLRSDLNGKVTIDILDLLGIFEEGRPLFGNKIVSSWSYYGYLTACEMKKLYIALDELSESNISDNLREFLFALTDWLDGISSQNLDLYFYIS